MQVRIKKLVQSEVEMEIEVPVGEFDFFIEQAILELGKDLEIKGFRKGRVPREIIEKEMGSEKILMEAADLAVKENYKKAVLENKIEAIFQPKIEIKKLARGNDFVFSAKTAVLPGVELPDYKKIASKVERRKISIEEKEVEEGLKWFQKSRAKFILKNQPAQKGDFVEIEYWLPEKKEWVKDAFILGEGHFIPGFEEKIIGMEAGEEKEEKKEPSFKIKVKSVQSVEFPKISAEELGPLKEKIRQGIKLEKEQIERLRVRQEILDKISEKSKCEIPEILIKEEQKQMLENIKKGVRENLKISFEDYLSRIKKTEKEILDSLLPQVQKRVKNFLILREIGKKEFDPVRDSGNKEKASKEQISNGVDAKEIKDYNEESEKIEKIFQLLEKI